MKGQHQIQQILLWVIHVERVAILVLVAVGGVALALRILLLRRRAKGAEEAGPAWIKDLRGLSVASLSLGAAFVSGWFAIQPDAFFLTQMGRDAVARQDPVDIITYYEPLVRGNRAGLDVYENLALAYVSQRRPREAIAVLHQVLAISPVLEHHLICASLHLALGEASQVLVHVEAARSLAQTPDQRAAVERLAVAARTPAAPGR